ncbi:hypothetical protein G6045_17280 [Streptomyces sp. YC504]|uniref:Uncharacterized protein n=1 Tax=Streptomyces mesophilus TaxID=1775132 RepID=A0A6G4XKN6_9ACTN|nr:hypothetical protein [Streptomyces mesophilus]NGO77400.1 hypothetical protein [Streptomyces mesophilus]
MANRKQAVPPRALAVGDVVAAPARVLGEWTAAQIVRIHADTQTVAVLELDWSGPEPSSVGELGAVVPLRLSHHAWNGALSFCNRAWILPRSHKVIGSMALLHDEPSHSYAFAWDLGDQLARQRRWDAGVREDPADAWTAEYTGEAVNEFLGRPAAPRAEVAHLTVRDIDELDCARLVRRFPGVTRLQLYGRLGLLTAAGELNRLTALTGVSISDLFGMTEEDVLRPRCVPQVESLDLYSVPAAYASAMRRTWRPEIPAGTYVSVLRSRKPEWVEENRNNPLRDWDGREHISAATYRRAVSEYKATRKAVFEAAEGPAEGRSARMEEIGRAYGEAFNRLDRRAGFIETVEREELFDVLDHIVKEAEVHHGPVPTAARDSLISGVEGVRDW